MEKFSNGAQQDTSDLPMERASPRAAHARSEHTEDGSRGLSPHQVEVLTRAMKLGNEEAFHEFYDAYFDRLLRYLFVVTNGDEQTARDALQQTLIRVVRYVKIFDDEEKFWKWLTVLARSALVDESRKQRRWFAFLDRFSQCIETEKPAVNGDEVDRRLGELLEQGVSTLLPDEQELIKQKYFSHRSVREIAESLQMTEKAIESKLSRIRSKLKHSIHLELKNEP